MQCKSIWIHTNINRLNKKLIFLLIFIKRQQLSLCEFQDHSKPGKEMHRASMWGGPAFIITLRVSSIAESMRIEKIERYILFYLPPNGFLRISILLLKMGFYGWKMHFYGT